MIVIRAITPADAESYWDLRLNALKEQSRSILCKLSRILQIPIWNQLEHRIQVTDDNFILGAFNNETIIGMIGFVRERTKKLNHKSNIWGTYVAQDFRSQGIGRKLLDETIFRAKKLEGLSQINLGVITF